MIIKEYIESGILEAYILGSLPPEEEILVEANIAQFPDLADELMEIEAAMQRYSETLATQPPAGLETRIWDSISAQGSQDASGNAGSKETAPGPQQHQSIPFKPEYRKPAQRRYAIAASVALLAGSLAVNMLLWNQTRQGKEEKTAMNERMDKLQNDQKQLAQTLTDYQKQKSMMADTGMQTIVMHTIVKGHAMAATMYWSKASGAAYVSVDALPAPPKGMQYQLWAIQGGKPVDMGVLPNSMASTPTMQKVNKEVTSGEAFAISLEKEGGSPTPTMQNIYVMGKPS